MCVLAILIALVTTLALPMRELFLHCFYSRYTLLLIIGHVVNVSVIILSGLKTLGLVMAKGSQVNLRNIYWRRGNTFEKL